MYERFFGLVDAPFRLTPDPRYLFLSRKHADALAHLKLGLTESSGFVCVTGDVGTGKTTLLRAFLAGLGPDTSTAYIFNPALSSLELLQTINSEFGLLAASSSKKDLVDALNRHLLAQREAGRCSLVVVDEAQALQLEVLEQLRLLSNLETTTDKLLRIILVGQPQLRSLLQHPALVQLNQRITLRWHMGPLVRSETAAYVRHRLRIAGEGQEARIFTRPALRLVHRLSGGVPRLINMIAHRAMLAAFAVDGRTVTRRRVRRVHREIESVPLPAPPPAPRRLVWAAVGGGIAVGVLALAVGWLVSRPEASGPASAALEAPASPADPGAGMGAGMGARVDPHAAGGPAPPEATPEPAPAPAPPSAGEAPVEVARAEVPEAAPPPGPEQVEQRLAGLTPADSARAAVEVLLAAWGVAPLAPGEPTTTADLDLVARRRGLEHLSLAGNAGMLRLLDLPAILELRAPDAAGARYAALTEMGVGSARSVLVLDGTRTPVDSAFLERHWFGQAHLFWRDFDALGPATLAVPARGPQVARLQALLRRAGTYSGPENGDFSVGTGAAVLAFQRSRLILADGRVGPLTSIMLYAAAGFPRPTLSAVGASS